MRVPQIRLESTSARISMNSTPATMEISQPKADLSIEQPKAEMNIERTPSQLTIDQTKAWEDMDLKHISKRIEEAADQGHQDWLAGLARRSQEGEDLMRIEDGGNPIPQHAQQNSEPPIYDFNIGWIPSHDSVKINYTPGKVDIQWKRNDPIIQAKTNKPTLNVERGKVDIEMEQRASLKIDFDNLYYRGIKYEQKI
ncbi:DUF6470 family protein [Metabacillus iocasae]|uniref:Uncharacterized protein n=1 Tax=Priestia iocasae TaxID=2291674 RepID=A0ABS2QYB8_9BACI|nr:DUF6470 family protein [Metabacillus iocasae]MBM7704466.1 hypothetical protein [Metabacillus iocasae]